MKTWQKILIPFLIVTAAAGLRLYFVFRERQNPGILRQGPAEPKLTQDQLAVVRHLYLVSFDQAKQLEGTTVWIKAGYSLPYYPYAGGQVEFARSPGVLPAAEKLAVSKLIKAVTPAKENNRIPHGNRQYFIVFKMPDEHGEPGQFAAPIGYIDGSDEKFYADQLFYYDDPRKIYDNWPAPVWDAVAAHTPKVGLSENQTRMAVGILMETDSSSEGNRTVTYVAGPKKWTVTFANDKATSVQQDSLETGPG
jgi:hypothetical protein